MSDEPKASQDDFEESLARAAAEIVEPAVEEQPAAEEQLAAEEEPKEEIKPEPDDNAERSRLGRKVQRLEDTIAALQQQLTAKMEAAKEEQYSPEDIVTVADVDKLFESREKRKQKELLGYQTAYGSSFIDMSRSLDDATAIEVEEEMLKNFNEIVTGDPKQDARINFLRAENSVLKKKTTVKTNPLKGERPQAINTTGKTAAPKKTMPKLDAAAVSFLKKEGLSMDWAEKALAK